MKAQGSTLDVQWKLLFLSIEEVHGIPGVEVKFVDIGRNTSGEGDELVDD